MKYATPKNLVRVASMVTLITIGAYIRIPTPWVPLTLQSAAVLMAGIVLGSKLASLSVILYLLIGIAGIPVFAAGGGPGYMLMPTFGYILGFIPAAWISGMAVNKKNPSYQRLLIYLTVALLSIYLIGVPYLIISMKYIIGKPVSLKQALVAGFLIPLPGDAIKCLVACFVGIRIRRVLQKGDF